MGEQHLDVDNMGVVDVEEQNVKPVKNRRQGLVGNKTLFRMTNVEKPPQQ